MKTYILIAAMLTTALTVSAQSATRSTKPEEKKAASTETRTVRSSTATRQSTASSSKNATPNRSSQSASASNPRSDSQPANRPSATVNNGNRSNQSEHRSSSAARPVQPERSIKNRNQVTEPARSSNTYRNGNQAVDPRPSNHSANRPIINNNDYHYVYPKHNVKHHYNVYPNMTTYKVSYYPRHSDIIWTRGMHRIYVGYYPWYNGWHYKYGYRVRTISSFDAEYNIGEVARVYGRVYATWYNQESDDYLLFFGGEFPYQHLTVIVPGKVARKYSWRPERYFLGQHVTMTGLITSYEGRPEMVIHNRSQFSIY